MCINQYHYCSLEPKIRAVGRASQAYSLSTRLVMDAKRFDLPFSIKNKSTKFGLKIPCNHYN